MDAAGGGRLILAGPLNWLTGQKAGPALSALLSTWDDREPPPILVRAQELSLDWQSQFAAVAAKRAAAAQERRQMDVPRAA